jgi:hypothetical protein
MALCKLGTCIASVGAGAEQRCADEVKTKSSIEFRRYEPKPGFAQQVKIERPA